jgi:hypothetical protein
MPMRRGGLAGQLVPQRAAGAWASSSNHGITSTRRATCFSASSWPVGSTIMPPTFATMSRSHNDLTRTAVIHEREPRIHLNDAPSVQAHGDSSAGVGSRPDQSEEISIRWGLVVPLTPAAAGHVPWCRAAPCSRQPSGWVRGACDRCSCRTRRRGTRGGTRRAAAPR